MFASAYGPCSIERGSSPGGESIWRGIVHATTVYVANDPSKTRTYNDQMQQGGHCWGDSCSSTKPKTGTPRPNEATYSLNCPGGCITWSLRKCSHGPTTDINSQEIYLSHLNFDKFGRGKFPGVGGFRPTDDFRRFSRKSWYFI